MEKKEENIIYLDYNATTPIHEEVIKEMIPFLKHYGNPSSNHKLGNLTKTAINKARKQVSEMINCSENEIIFTSGGSESNNFAIKGVMGEYKKKGNHIITSIVEHASVSDVCKYLSEEQNCEVTYLSVDKTGKINLEELKNSITEKTILISIMHAQNEVGTIQPIQEISKIAKENQIIFHSDVFYFNSSKGFSIYWKT
jgi:cysteine desulfurase